MSFQSSAGRSPLQIAAGVRIAVLAMLPTLSFAQTLFDHVRVDYDLPSTPADSVSADFTGDGLPDVFVTVPDSSLVALFINRGDGVFLPPLQISVVNGPKGCAAGDIDGDNDLDVVVALSNGSGVRKLINDGFGNFTDGGVVSTTESPAAVTLGKFDGDSDLDIFTISSIGLQFFANDGSANFGGGASVILGGGTSELETRDLNADGKLDVVALNLGATPGLYVLLGNGDGTFAAPAFSSTGTTPRRLDIVDFAGSSHPDIVVANSDSSNLSLHVNNGAGVFPSTSTLSVLPSPTAVRGVDLDGDGDTDLFVPAYFGFQSRVYLNDGSGGFNPGDFYALPGGGALAEVDDFDDDGLYDFIVGTSAGISSFRGNGVGGYDSSTQYADLGPVRGIASADMNGDGDNDLVSIIESSGGILRIRLNDGLGGFATVVDYPQAAGPRGVVLADFDGDEDVDVAFSKDGVNGAVGIYLNNGDGSLATPVVYQPGNGNDGIVAADLDGDVDIDLAVSCAVAGHVRILVNNGSGAFSLGPAIPLSSSPRGITAADIDNDEDIDLFAACPNTDQIAVLTNGGSGTFASSMFATGDGPMSLAAADLNGDDLPELIVPLTNDKFTRVYPNLGGGTFGPAQSLPTGLTSAFAEVADLDGNGTPDIAVSATNGNRVSVINNLGSMILVNYADYEASNGPGPLALADLDGNGSIDIAIGHAQAASTSILSNSIPTVVSAKVISDHRIIVEFSEAVSNGDLLTTNYALSGSAQGTLNTFPDSVMFDTPKTRTLTWGSGEMFDGGDATITVTGFLRDDRLNPLGFTPSRTDEGGGIGYAPTGMFTTDFGDGVIQPLFQVDLDFSELVSGFSDADVEVTNGQIVGSVSAGQSHTFDVVADAEGPVTLTLPAGAYSDLAGNPPAADASISVVYDVTAPVLSIGTIDPTRVGPDPVAIDFNFSDAGIGIESAKVWSRKKGLPDYELVAEAIGGGGSIDFSTAEEGVYEFAITGIDKLGNGIDVPNTPSLTAIYNADGGSFTHVDMDAATYLYPLTNDLDVEVTITGTPAIPPTITVARLVGDGAPATLDPTRLIDERLDIQGALNGGFGTIKWPFDPANAASLVGPIETVFQVEGGVVVGQFPGTVIGDSVKFGPVSAFSEWWAGNSQTTVAGWESFD